MNLHEQARAEAEKRWPDPSPTHPQIQWKIRDHRKGYVEGYLAGHEAATRTRVVTTVAELDALPIGSVVMTEEGWLAKKFETTQTQHWDVTERWRRGNYPDVRLIEHGPLTVLYEPEASQDLHN
jgi:hypothetical protein